jgi:hypothetical protein
MLHRTALAIAVSLTIGPAAAQDTAPEGESLMERGMDLFFEGLRKEMSPALDNLRGLAEEFGPSMRSFMQEMGPAFGSILDEVKDWSSYHPPEMMPNGDIILRKKTDPEPTPTDPPPPGQTDI